MKKKEQLDFWVRYQICHDHNATYLWFLCSDGNGVMHGCKLTGFTERFFEWLREKGVRVEEDINSPSNLIPSPELPTVYEQIAKTESMEKCQVCFPWKD